MNLFTTTLECFMNNVTTMRSLGLALMLSVLAGCTSTSTQDQDSANNGGADSGVTVGGSENAGVNDVPEDTMEDEVVLDTVFYFDFDQSMLKPAARAALTAHAERLKANPESIRLEGHGDETGTREYNMALGERRGIAVRDFLSLQGVDASSIEVISYGEERPASMGSSDSAYSQNRRVELK